MIEKYSRKYQRKQLRETQDGGGEGKAGGFCYKPCATSWVSATMSTLKKREITINKRVMN